MRRLGELHDVVDAGRVVARAPRTPRRPRRAACAACAARGRAARGSARAHRPVRAGMSVAGSVARCLPGRAASSGFAPAVARRCGPPRAGYADVTPVSRSGLRSRSASKGSWAKGASWVQHRARSTTTQSRSATRTREEFPALTRTMFVKYAGASGDFNPMHHDDTIATQVGNPSVFGHGMLTMGLAARVVKDWFGPEAMRRFQVRFSKQVWPGDVLTCTAVGHRQARRGRREARRPRAHRRQPERRQGDHRRGDRRRRAEPRWGCSTDASRSSPDRAAASAASSRCASRARARTSSSTTSACRLDGAGHRRRPGGAGVQGDRGARRRRPSRTTTR